MFLLFGLLFFIWFWFCPCLPLWCCYFCHLRTPMELSLFEKGFLGYPWYSWLCISQFHILQYFSLVFHISLCEVDFKMFSFLYVNLLYLKCVLLFLHDFDVVLNKMKWIKWNEMKHAKKYWIVGSYQMTPCFTTTSSQNLTTHTVVSQVSHWFLSWNKRRIRGWYYDGIYSNLLTLWCDILWREIIQGFLS